jgi:hypothetical protein
MKKIFSGLISGIIFYSAIVSNVKAQMSLASMSTSKTAAFPALASVQGDKSLVDEKIAVSKDNLKETKADLKNAKANLKAVKANFKAFENFKKNFAGGADVKWAFENDVISASFNRDNIQTRVIYNKRGNWVHTISYFPESRIPKKIKSLIRSNYPDYNINGMNEINEGNITFYMINLEDDTSYKQVSVYNDQMEVYKEFKKSQ